MFGVVLKLDPPYHHLLHKFSSLIQFEDLLMFCSNQECLKWSKILVHAFLE